jgi:catechol 2,3-dioxygenase-like lactoylglutathione lyase family enzyme
MTTIPPVKLQAFAAVFTVGDVGRSLPFFCDRLGFREHFRLGDPVSYAIVERDAVSIHLMPASDSPETLGHSSIYVFAADVDALHAELQALGCAIEVPPADFVYGMREMSVRDPDGNRITFGQEVRTTVPRAPSPPLAGEMDTP